MQVSPADVARVTPRAERQHSSAKKQTILFLAANPDGTDPRKLDREARSIAAELKRSGHRHRFEFVTRWAVEPLDLLREVRELKPAIVHFSGHGAHDGLQLHDVSGRPRVVSPAAIAEAIRATGAPVQLAVLNACFTESVAEALLPNIPCVVGMGGSIHSDAARAFAVGFYGGLGAHESIAVAFEQGRAAINLEALPDAERPRLKLRGTGDAELVLAEVAPPALAEIACPYRGMRPYTTEDASSFYGRETEVTELIGRLRAGEREIFVIGPSGSGKSSLVVAGVLPKLARGVSGVGPFVVREMRPGEHPAEQLERSLELAVGAPRIAADHVTMLLAHRAPSTSLLIVIDQMEELFTLADAAERARFLDMLRALQEERRCTVIFTLRADFFGTLMESALWAERRGQLSRLEIAPLRGESLRAAITGPADAVGVTVEPALVRQLVADAASEPGILPLLQETLVQLWDRRTDQTLTLADYESLGDGQRNGLAVAMARRGDATLRKFAPAQTAVARRTLLRLISFGEGRSDTRRQQPRPQLYAADDNAADFGFVLQTMIEDRLLTVDDDVIGDPRVDLAHEILISAWPTLAGWIASHRADEQRRRRLEAAAAEWAEHGRTVRGLLDPIELADAERWRRSESAVQLGNSEDVLALIAASRAAQAQQRRRVRGLLGGAFTLLVSVIVVIAMLAIAERDQADNALREADHASASDRERRHQVARLYMEQGRELVVDERYEEAIPYLLEARRNELDSPPLRMLFHVAERHLPLAPPFEHQGAVHSAAFSPDGLRIVTASGDHTARVWDASTGQPLFAPLTHPHSVASAAFSRDGAHVVTASDDHTPRVWDAAAGKTLFALPQPRGLVLSAFSPDGARVVIASDNHTARVWDTAIGQPLSALLTHQDLVASMAFSRDGARVVTASWDHTARVWDAATGRPLSPPLAHQGQVTSVAFSQDGARIVTASWGGVARVWDAATGRPLSPLLAHQGQVTSVAFSQDGARIVTASDDHTARVWDAVTGQPLSAPLTHQDLVTSAVFSPDGARVVTASDDHTARVWDATTGKSLSVLLPHQELVRTAAFSPNGTRVVTASSDYTARVWDTATGQPLSAPLKHQGGVWSAAFSPDGARIVTASADCTARVWDAATGRELSALLKHHDVVKSAAFSPDGARIVTASADCTARVWDAATGQSFPVPLTHQGAVTSAAFSPDGMRVVTASADCTARVWDTATGQPLSTPLTHQGPVTSAAFSPDGLRVVTASDDHTARVWDAATGRPLSTPLAHQGPVTSAAFSPDGARVVTASDDHTARIWDASTGRPLSAPLTHQGPVASAMFSPDGARVVTASDDHTARVWDAITGQPLSAPLKHQDQVTSAAFSPDGARIVTASWDHTARLWDVGLDMGTLEEWSRAVARSAFVLDGETAAHRALSRAAQQPAR